MFWFELVSGLASFVIQSELSKTVYFPRSAKRGYKQGTLLTCVPARELFILRYTERMQTTIMTGCASGETRLVGWRLLTQLGYHDTCFQTGQEEKSSGTGELAKTCHGDEASPNLSNFYSWQFSVKSLLCSSCIWSCPTLHQKGFELKFPSLFRELGGALHLDS